MYEPVCSDTWAGTTGPWSSHWYVGHNQTAIILYNLWTCLKLQSQLFYIATCALTFVSIQESSMLTSTTDSGVRVEVTRFVNAAYCLTIMLAKISLGLFFINLFGRVHRIERLLTHLIIALTTIPGIMYLSMSLASCGITVWIATQDCALETPYRAISTTWSVLNALADLAFAALAINTVRRCTNLSFWSKFSATILLVFGSLACFASVLRVVQQVPRANVPADLPALAYWSNVEAGVAITAASLATLRPLVRRVVHTVSATCSPHRSGSDERGHERGHENEQMFEPGYEQDWTQHQQHLRQSMQQARQRIGSIDAFTQYTRETLSRAQSKVEAVRRASSVTLFSNPDWASTRREKSIVVTVEFGVESECTEKDGDVAAKVAAAVAAAASGSGGGDRKGSGNGSGTPRTGSVPGLAVPRLARPPMARLKTAPL